MSTHNVCFEQKYENYQIFLSENFHFLVVKFSVYLNRHVFVMCCGNHLKQYMSINYSNSVEDHPTNICAKFNSNVIINYRDNAI